LITNRYSTLCFGGEHSYHKSSNVREQGEETKEGQEESNRVAAAWVKESLPGMLSPVEITAGEGGGSQNEIGQ
jgi:hypothetical protein